MANLLTPATKTLMGYIRAALYNNGVGSTWPPRQLAPTWEQIGRYAAFRCSDEVALRQYEGLGYWNRYMISPVPRMISRAKANLLFGEPAEFEAANEADQDRLENIVRENDLDALDHTAAVLSSSEGEVWGRIVFRPDLLDVPIIEYVSRGRVIPYFSGRFLVGATFITEFVEGDFEIYRLFETYDRGSVSAELFRGTRTSLGQPQDLGYYPQTAGTPEVAYTGIPEPLIAFIPNSIDANPARGYSDYAGLLDRFLGINRAVTTGDTNTELAGKQRALVDGTYVGRNNTLNADDVYVRDDKEGSIESHKPLEILEYTYNAEQIVKWLDHLIDSTLQFGGAAPQLVGRSIDGAAVSGTALRFKAIHSLLEASGSGRYFDRGLQRLLRQAAVIDSRPVAQLGFGRGWTDVQEKPTIARQDGLPTDDFEAAQELSLLVGAEAISIEERVAFLHPEWTEDQQKEEVQKIKDENAPVVPPSLPGGPGGDPQNPPGGPGTPEKPRKPGPPARESPTRPKSPIAKKPA